jgi:hypothetical protein
MSFSLHHASAPLLVSKLKSLNAFLDKAEATAKEHNYDVAVLLQSRLAPDMAPLVRQVQMTCDHAKFTMQRLGAVDAPSFPDTETTIEELKERIVRTIAYVESVPAAKVEGAVDREIAFKAGPMELKMQGGDYLTTWALPNFFFHLTTAGLASATNGAWPLRRPPLGRRP